MKRYVIVGNGVAGVEAAKVIRENDDEASITIISKERDLFYYRPRLIDYIAGKVGFEQIIVYHEKWYTDRNIKCVLGVEVIDILADEKKVVLDNGDELEYTKLLLANGSDPFILPVEGINKDGVFTIKDRTDVDNIKEYCKDKKKVIVVGGGLLGIETANSLMEQGLDVTVVEYADRLLPRQVDNDGSKVLEKMLKEKGFKFMLGESTKEIIGDGKVEKISMNSGKVLDVEVVIFSVGVRPRRDLADKVGLNFNKGVVVNEYMQTSDGVVYAAGDVAEHDGICYGLWAPAKEQGAIAGKNMATGNSEVYAGSKMEARLKVVGISLLSAGKIQGDGLVEKAEENDGAYVKTFEDNGDIVGAIVIGDAKEVNRLAKVIK
ncbi:MAG: hypothetical protein A2Y18_07040 [Clostridiales bacterium GWD2_32_19]|nr:MAG: hypothetical protein A2Y18_07040 [Clostridiales bacterium GWD2_32_19]